MPEPNQPQRTEPAWEVWRTDDNGGSFLVRAGLSRDEAQRLAADYETRGHKQTYWIRPEGGADR